jgi:hypothetical protein
MPKMGEWKLSGESTKCIVVSSGVVAVESKDPDQVADFSLRFWELKQLIEQNPKAKEYKMYKQSYYGLIRCVAESKLDRLGEVFQEERTIGCASQDHKRDYQLTPFTVLPKCGGDLLRKKYKSKAIDISLVMSKDIEINDKESE